MKKLVFASVLALASLCLAPSPTLRAQNSETISIKDPAEFNAYQLATSQSDPRTKASQLEDFLRTYPQSVVKKAVLDMLIDLYSTPPPQGVGDPDKALSAASRMLEMDPNNMKAIYLSVAIKKSQCLNSQDPKTGNLSDPQPCDDAAALARRGLAAPKPEGTTSDDWKKQTAATYPIFHSAIAQDDILSKKDYKDGIAEYRTELMLYPAEQTQSGPGLVDTLELAEAYVKQEIIDGKAAREADLAVKAATTPDAIAAAQKQDKAAKDQDATDLVQAIWFFARAWNFAPPAYKAQIEPKLEYYYKKYHGTLDGLNNVKTLAEATVFPPASFVITPAPTPADIVRNVIATTPDLTTLNLEDKEFILANGDKEDADKLWAVLKDQTTPVPGKVIDASATVIKMAVTQDAKDANIPDFIVNMKKPLEDKDIPPVGFEFGLLSNGQDELDGTYDTYTQVPATANIAQTAQIVLRDGFIQQVKKKPVPHKPVAGHRSTRR